MGATLNAVPVGMKMFTSGVEDCFNALFRPEVCANLKKYFTWRAIEYMASIAIIGFGGIK